MKVLNLDRLSKKEGRQLVIGDKTYEVQGMTVANFIETTKAAEALAMESSLVKQVEATIDMIVRSVPDAGREVLGQLTLEQLQTVVRFIRGDNDVEGVEASGTAPAAEAGESDAKK